MRISSLSRASTQRRGNRPKEQMALNPYHARSSVTIVYIFLERVGCTEGVDMQSRCGEIDPCTSLGASCCGPRVSSPVPRPVHPLGRVGVNTLSALALPR